MLPFSADYRRKAHGTNMPIWSPYLRLEGSAQKFLRCAINILYIIYYRHATDLTGQDGEEPPLRPHKYRTVVQPSVHGLYYRFVLLSKRCSILEVSLRYRNKKFVGSYSRCLYNFMLNFDFSFLVNKSALENIFFYQKNINQSRTICKSGFYTQYPINYKIQQ